MTVRRGKGEGSIYQRASDGRWVGIVDLGYVGGKRVRKTVYGKTQREVIAKRKALQTSIDSGVVPDNATLEQWITHWLERIAAHRNRPSTLRGYRTYVHQWIIPNLGHIRLSKLTPEHVRALHDAMRTAGKSPASIRQAHAILGRCLRVAAAERRTLINAAAIAGGPPVPTAHHAYLNADEARRVLLAALPGEDRLRWVCALMLGLRQGEALGLDWSMVSLDDGAGYVRVERALQRQTGKGLVMTDLKSQSSHRVVPLIPLVAAVFQDQLERSGCVGLVFGGGKPKDPRKDWGEWREALTRADAPLVPLHGARASCATLLRSQGVPERVIADILGHREVATTQAHYIRSDDAQRRAALAVLGPLLPIGQ